MLLFEKEKRVGMELKINNKVVAFDGCIGRREYILNMMIVNAFSALLTMPFSYWMAKSCQNPMEMFNFPALFASAPISVMFFYVLACLMCIVLHFGLVIRRISDIKGIPVNIWIYLLSGIFILVPYLWILKTNAWTALFLIITMIIGIVILCVRGKISSQLPHDELKRFNWGAFWGTWIWGLFNKTPITLLMLPLIFTPAFLTFMIICGIKGNEWAFKNTKALDSEEFHKKQKNQAIFWNSFAGFVIFVLPVLFVFVIMAYSVKTAMKDSDSLDKLSNTISQYAEDILMSEFTGYELDVDENKFYMEPEIWIKFTYSEKYDYFKGAASFASMKKLQSEEQKFEGYSGTRTDEMEITKIYSTYNGEILAEFNTEGVDDVSDFKSAMSAFMKALYFNTSPQIPPSEE